MQLGAFLPYFRNHANYNTRAAEPWTFGEDVLDITRRYIGLRYTMLPYLYSCFREASADGMPVLRSLAIDYTGDPLVYDTRYQEEFLFGPSVLVLPQVSGTAFAKAYLPSGQWYDAYTDDRVTGGERILELTQDHLPVFIRGGAIIPRSSLVQSTAEAPSDTLEVHCYKGADTTAFTYYEDDGTTYGYEQGDYYQRTMRLTPQGITLGRAGGRRPSRFKYLRLVLHGYTGGDSVAFLPGERQTIKVRTITMPNGPGDATIPF
jgi:alpha-glucosidase